MKIISFVIIQYIKFLDVIYLQNIYNIFSKSRSNCTCVQCLLIFIFVQLNLNLTLDIVGDSNEDFVKKLQENNCHGGNGI